MTRWVIKIGESQYDISADSVKRDGKDYLFYKDGSIIAVFRNFDVIQEKKNVS